MSFKNRLSLCGTTSIAALMLVGNAATAQTAQTAQTVPAAAVPATSPPASTATKEKPVETVVVTGSRLSRSTFTSTAPITVITSENTTLQGQIDVTESLQTSVAAAGSGQVNNSFTGFITQGGPGVNTIGLRGLGPGRTLVLMNGKRLPPAGTRGQTNAVDLNIIPTLAVDRTEVLRDGASATYGSDAIAGVVNLVTRKNLNGFEMDFASSLPEAGGAEQYRIGAVWGKTTENYNFLVSAEYQRFEELSLRDRDFSACVTDYVFDGATGARADFIDPATGTFYCKGDTIQNYIEPQGNALLGVGSWIGDPNITAYRTGVRPDTTPLPGSTVNCVNAFGNVVACNALLEVPGFRRLFYPRAGTQGIPLDYTLYPQTPLYGEQDIFSPVERTTIYASGAVDLKGFGGAELFGEALLNRRESTQDDIANFEAIIPRTFPGNPFTVAVRGIPGVGTKAAQQVDTWQVMAGLRGATGNGFGGFLKSGRWEVSAQTSSAVGTYTITDVLRDRRDASLAATSATSCPTPTLTGGTCLPIPWLTERVLSGRLTDQERAYLLSTDDGETTYKQTIIEGNINGEVFKLPAGPVSANFGFHYRNYSIDDIPPAEALRGNTLIFSTAGRTKGDDAVVEIMGEVELPILKGKPLVEDLTLNLQGRYTDYDSYDSNSTYKVSANWQISPEVRLRGGVGTSYRAPALFNLFLANQTGFISQANDPCRLWGEKTNPITRARCARDGVPATLTGGNSITALSTGSINNASLGLKPLSEETAKTNTIGIVWRPTFTDLQVSLDYSEVVVSDQVAAFGAANILFLCYTFPEEKYQFLCKNIKRNAAGNLFPFAVETVINPYFNISSAAQAEFAINIDYRKELAFGTFSVNSESTIQTKSETQFIPEDDADNDLGESGTPQFVNRTQFQFRKTDWTYTWTVSAYGKTSDNKRFVNRFGSNPTDFGGIYAFKGLDEIYYKTKAEATIYHGFTVRYRSDDWTIVGGVSNLFDEAPPAMSAAPSGGAAVNSRLGTALLSSQYDLRMRSYFVNLVRRF